MRAFPWPLLSTLLFGSILITATTADARNRISEADTTGRWKGWCKREIARRGLPKNGERCGHRRRSKTCYFGKQDCVGDEGAVVSHPVTKCECVNGIWDCIPELCPPPARGDCGSEKDCDDGQICFSPNDCFAGVCLTFPLACSIDDDCSINDGEVCDDRQVKCLCNGSGSTCNTACTANTDCAQGDTCNLMDGHCTSTTCTTDVDCMENFECSPETKTCARKTCLANPDCNAGGFCIKGRCFAEPGFCSFPPP